MSTSVVWASLMAKMVKNPLAMQERSLGQEGILERGMPSDCNILAWELPWIEESSRLQSMGL